MAMLCKLLLTEQEIAPQPKGSKWQVSGSSFGGSGFGEVRGQLCGMGVATAGALALGRCRRSWATSAQGVVGVDARIACCTLQDGAHLCVPDSHDMLRLADTHHPWSAERPRRLKARRPPSAWREKGVFLTYLNLKCSVKDSETFPDE